MKKLDDKQVEDIFALTPLQEGILFHYLDNSENNRDIYCEQLILDLGGEVDINVFKKAWNFVVETNEMLRTLFRWEKIENPVQMVLKPYEYKIDLRYYSFPPDATRTKRELITRIKNRDKKERFDLNQVPFRITLGKIRENRCVMIISHHHILYDGWSTGIILKEFFQAYRQFTNRNQLLKPKPPVKTKFKEFIKWIQHQDIPKQERYWKKYLKGLNAGTEIPIKAKTGKRTEINNKSPGNLIVQLPLDLQKEIGCFVKTHKVTLAALVYSSWGLLLQKYNNCSDVVFGTTVSGRSARVTGIENIVGLFINTLPLRVVSRTTESISELVHKIDKSLKQREEYENTPLVKIKEYSEIDSRQELFNTVMVIENYPLASEKIQENSSLTIDSYSSLEMTHYDLTIIIRESNGGIQIKFLYPNGLFYESAIERMSGHFTHMMQDMLKKPGDAPHRVELLSREERRRILVDFCDTDADYPNNKTIHRMFEEIVDQVPDRIALVAQAGVIPNKGVSCGGIQLSYCELNNRSNRWAHLLRLKGVQPDSVVGITAERSAEMIIGILAILKAGGAYLPIDPDYPQERINYMLKDSNVRLIIKKSEIRNPKSETYPNDPNSNDQNKKAGVTVLDFEHLNFEFSIGCPRRGLSNFEIRASNLSPSNLAYVIYTSGSTGKPKGVLVEHAPVINLLAGLNRDYSFGENGVYLLKTSYVFDVSVTELFGWFWGRSKLAVLEKDGEKDPQKILNTIERIGVTHINFVPSLFHAFVDYMHLNPQNIVKCSGLRYIFLAGEALFPALVKHFEELNLENRLENLYGPTEAAVYASGYSLSQWDGQGSIPIGKPLANIRLYILDRFVQLQPIGMPGELGISGAGLARGYLNQPGLTAEKFVRIEVKVDEEEYRSYRSHRSYINHLSYIYKTGDLVRWLPDGNIEFLGRIDQQVKIRGYRVELGEIENWLLKHHQVKEALVLAREKENNEKYLCAYIIPAATGAIDDFTSISTGIKEYLSKKLPAYMIPTCFVGLPKMPLTVSGKINRNALPEPEVGPTLEYVSPRNKTEELMAAIWAKVLGIGKKPIGIDDNFFQLGGHSLTATRLAARIHKVFDLEIPPKQLFNTPTIRGLVLYIGESARSSFTPCEPVEKKEYYALSSAQRRLFVLQRLDVLHTTYNITGMVQLEGRLHPEVFDRCFRELLHRYESLRTSFHMVAGEPVQRIHKSIKFEIEYYDKKEVEVKVGDSEGTRGLAPLPIELVGRKAQSAEHDAQCIEWNKERHAPCAMRYTSFIRPFDLSRAPLLRVIFINISRENHLLVVDIHHIAADGVSIGMLIHELMSLYSGEPEKLPPIKIQYKDFSEWKNRQKVSEAVKKQEAYWVNEFAGEIPVLNLPGDYPRPPGPSSAGSTEGFEISERETAALQRYHRETGTTLFMLLLAIFNVWLSKLSSQEDIVVGTPETGRHYLEFENVIGMFVNTLALRNRPIGEKQFSRLLKEVKERTLEAFENRDYPFENLVEKVGPRGDLSRSPLFDVMFALQDPDSREIKLPGLSVKMVDYENPTSKFDLALEARESAGKLDFKIQYSTRLFKPQTIKRFITYFKELILSLLENPGTRISRANVLPPGEKQAILYDFNNTAMEYPGDKNWLQLFEEQADKSPGLTCAVFEHQHITYKELNEKAICLAILLGKKGVRRGTIVGVMADRSLELMIGIIGILKSGGIYLPITPAYPTARVNYMIADTNAWLLLTGKIYQEKAKESSQQEVIFLDEEWGKFKERENPGNSNKKGKGSRGLPYQCSEVAYIIYTSGSTGRPKGSIIQHTALLNFIFSMYKNYNYDFSKRDNCLSLTSISFDVSICELFLPLIFGSTIVLLRDDKVFDAEAIASTIIERSVTFTYLPPALLRDTFANLIGDRLKTALNKLLVGVEPIKDHVLESFFKLNNKMRIINGYGPTEATICASNYIYRSHKTSGKIVPIGKPLGNTGIYIVDKNETPVPIGIGGELCISGAGLSRGYLNRPELTAGKFCLRRPVGALFEKSAPPGPPCKNFLLLPLPHYPIYMTGDLARWQPDGNIEFLGRIDNQIKIRGIRVEPGEIE
ncbi:MAG: amino acid adenylation domain-containing protein, partial [Candidatus Aminicenantes bacterium]